MQMNWIDLVIILFVVYEIYRGWESGFAALLANLGSFLGSLWLAVRYHAVVGNFFVTKFGVAPLWNDVIGYIVIALAAQAVLEEVFVLAVNKLPKKFHTSKINHWLGGALSSVNACIIVAFFLLLILSLPIRGSVKQDIRSSTIGRWFVVLSERYGGEVQSSLEEIAREAGRFLTVSPGSRERLPVDVPEQGVSFTIDAATEAQMVTLVNNARAEKGLPALRVDPAITEVSRGKSRDMFERKYFSHYDPDGKNAADRMNAAGVAYAIVGENLAYAPTLTSAHDGLMNSEGHRANILESRFHRIGIGVIDGGFYGKMFTQIFAD
jgi:uncharacterized protein YkwD/uncharacterized membrane protein required for colicin V production